jgi:amino acid transporter
MHSPVFAVLITMIASIITLALFSFTNIVTITIDISLAWCIQTAFAAVGMIVFPYVSRNLFEQAPSWAKKKFASIPAMTIVGVVLLVFMLIISYFAWTASTVMAANLGMLGILLVGFVLYPAVHYYRKRQGINLSLLFAQIPPE